MYLLFNKTINNIEVGCSYLAFTIRMSEKWRKSVSFKERRQYTLICLLPASEIVWA